MARRNAREKARRKDQQAGMTERFRGIMELRKRHALAAVSKWHRARLRGASKAAADVRATLANLFATMRIVSFEDAYKAHARLHHLSPLDAQAEVDEFHAAAFASWVHQPNNKVWHTVTEIGLTEADTAVTDPEVRACITGPGKPTRGWRLMVRKNDPVWIAATNRHESWGNGHAKALQKAIDDAVALGLIDAPANPVPQLAPIKP